MIWVGTSGYNYPEWKGSFYPKELPAAKMLPYYAARFPTVEINYTFYRMPTEKLVAGWAAQTPSPYKLTLKAPRRITHDSRLRNCGPLLATFCGVAGSLGDKLGTLLFQLPPTAKKDLPLFDAFLGDLPPGARGAFEFRHVSILIRIVHSVQLRKTRQATPAYRLSTADDIARWAGTIARETARCRDVFVYFKHEEEGKGPEFARLLMQHLGIASDSP